MTLRVACLAVVLVFVLAAAVERSHAQQPAPSRQTGDLETIQVRPNLYVLSGAGGNVVVHLGWMGAVVVDTGSAENADRVLSAIQRITDTQIRFIINTGADPDHVGGNATLARAGRNLLRINQQGGFAGSNFQTNDGAAGVMAHENVLTRMSSAMVGDKQVFPGVGWPTEAYTGARVKSLYLNGDGVQMMHQPSAHSDADSIVFFRRADVLVAGDVIDLRSFPIIDLENGGSINGEIAALNLLIDLSVPPAPLVWHEDRTFIIPGHGRVMDQADVVEYRDMVVVVRDRIQDMIDKRMTLDQIRKADPAKGYRTQYGTGTGPGSTDGFITAVHRSLTAQR